YRQHSNHTITYEQIFLHVTPYQLTHLYFFIDTATTEIYTLSLTTLFRSRRRCRRRRRHGGLECLRERGRGGKAIRRYFGESLPDYLLDSRWHRLPHGAEPWHGVHRLARRDGMRRGRHERGVSRQHLVQHTRETID